MVFIQWKKCLNRPKQILKLIAVVICLCVACYQLSECFSKILHPPISTHYSFHLNETLSFPALTICRNPPYKVAVFDKYGMGSSGPKQTTAWRSFKFANYTMDQFFGEATFTFNEILPWYGFDRYQDRVIITSTIIPEYGRCFIMTPINETTPWPSFGYSLVFSHTDTVRSIGDNGMSTSGYNVFIHDRREVYTGDVENLNTLVDQVYIENGEDLRLNLKVQSYVILNTKENPCNDSYFYSQSLCLKECIAKRVTEEVGCSTPWFINYNLPLCDDYNKTYTLMKLYAGKAAKYAPDCGCLQVCHLRVYTPYIQNRKEVTMPESDLVITFSCNLVTMMKEVLGYDWNLFLSDLGGSLGFLLGISVIGLISALEHMIQVISNKKHENLMRRNETPAPNLDKKLDNRNVSTFLNDKQFIGDLITENSKTKSGEYTGANLYTPQEEKHDFDPKKY